MMWWKCDVDEALENVVSVETKDVFLEMRERISLRYVVSRCQNTTSGQHWAVAGWH